jgi:hypothetical protein
VSIDNNNDKKPDKRRENIFEIMDGIIDQLNNTKRLFIAMILTVMIIPPLVFIVAFELITSTSDNPSPPPSPPSIAEMNHHYYKGEHRGGGGLFGGSGGGGRLLSTITKYVPLIIGILWLGIGIRQWIVLSKWSRKYQRYKELQKKIDEEMEDGDDSYGNSSNQINGDNSKR